MEQVPGLEIVRNAFLAPEVRAKSADSAGDSLGELEVAFSEFGQWYEISSYWEGDFMESTDRGSFKKTMTERASYIKALYDHGYDPSIGNKVLGPIRSMTEKPTGPVGIVDLLDTSYNRDLLPGLRSGVYGSSFRFQVVKEAWNDDPGVSDYNPKGLPERTIQEVKLFEFGPVTFPASEAATSGMRFASGTDSFYARSKSPAVEGMLARARAIREPDRNPRHHSRSVAQNRARLIERGIK